MRMSWAAAAAILLICAGARAEGLGGVNGGVPVNGETTIGVGVLCNTAEQAVRFLSLRDKGKEPQQAIDVVNTEAHQPRACGVAVVAFISDQTTDVKTVGGKLVRIVRINVIAGFNGVGWQRVAGMVQYAVVEAAGETI